MANKTQSFYKWQSIIIAELERETQHEANADADARKGIPKTEQLTLGVREREIIDQGIDKIDTQVKEAKEVLQIKENIKDALEKSIENDSFHTIASDMGANLNRSIQEFSGKIIDQYHDWNKHKKEYAEFKSDHRLSRPSSLKSSTVKLFSLILVAGLLIFEISVNSGFLRTALPGGFNEAKAMAQSIAFVNVLLSFLIGMGVMRNLNHYKKSTRISGGLILSLYILLFVWLNFMLGIYRTLAANATNAGVDITEVLMTEWGFMAAQPWANLDSINVQGWILVIMGISFATISLFDGYFFADTYPGYGKMGEKLRDSELNYLKIKDKFQKSGKVAHENSRELAKERQAVDYNNREELDELLNNFQETFNEYNATSYKWNNAISHCIAEYRNINSEKRTTPSPEYFNISYSLGERETNPALMFTSQYESCFMKDVDRKDYLKNLNTLNTEHYDRSIGEIDREFSEYNKNLERLCNENSIY